MKKKIIDEMNNIHEELIEKSIEIDTKEKLLEAKRGEMAMARNNIIRWVCVGVTCICLFVVGGIYLFNDKSLNTNNTDNRVRSCPTGYVLNKDNDCEKVSNDDPNPDDEDTKEDNKYLHNEYQSEVNIQPYALMSSVKIKSNGLEDFDLQFIKLNNDEENIVYSPLSIKYALEMLSEGAKGNTKKQIDAILGSYKAGKYYNSKNVSFANALFVNESVKDSINKGYIDGLKNKFNASLIYDTFESAQNINSWISDKTLGMINDLLTDEMISDRFFAIVNALAIDMEWVNRIQPHEEDIDDGNYMPGFEVRYLNESEGLYVSAYDASMKVDFNDEEEALGMHFGSIYNNYDIIKDLGEANIRATVKKAYEKYLADEDVQEYLRNYPEDRIEDFDKYLDNYIKDLKSNYKKSGTSTDYRYYVDNSVKVFAKDLKKYNGTQFEYIQIMPTNVKLNDYIKYMKASDINNLINKLIDPNKAKYKEGYITRIIGSLPAFKFEYTMNLIANLNQLGIYDVFVEDKADLTGIIKENTYVDTMIHNATFEFSNDGIKAAAVTMVGGAGDDGLPFNYTFDVPVEEIDLTFDKPFIYLVREKTTGEIWFAGAMYHPATEEIDWESIEW